MREAHRVVGIDVGGARKGYHAVALGQRGFVAKIRSPSPVTIAAWCRDLGAGWIGVDAPCRWRSGDDMRSAERQLIACGIRLYPTPTRARALEVPFFQWMLHGEALFRELEVSHVLFDDTMAAAGRRIVFETFPHAISCALAGRMVAAKDKRLLCRMLLESVGICTSDLTSQDELDAALCAWAARSLAEGRFKAYGDRATGHIIVPTGETTRLTDQ